MEIFEPHVGIGMLQTMWKFREDFVDTIKFKKKNF